MRRSIIRRVPQSPSINWRHPLARGLVGCYLPGVAGGKNLAGGGGDLVFQSGATVGAGQEGSGAVTISTAGLIGTTPPAFYAGNNFTYYWRGYVSAASASFAPILMLSDQNSWAGNFIAFGCRSDFSGTLSAIQPSWNGNNTSQNFSIQPFTATGVTQSTGATADYVANTIRGFTNGIFAANHTLGTKTNPQSTSQVCIGCEPSGGDQRALNAITYCGYFYTRTLSDIEMAMLDANPYCFLVSSPIQIPASFVGASGPPPSFIAAWAMNSNLPVIGTGNY